MQVTAETADKLDKLDFTSAHKNYYLSLDTNINDLELGRMRLRDYLRCAD